MSKVAVITGGDSGIGLAVVEALVARGGWILHILGIEAERGEEVAKSLPNTIFHLTNVVKYSQLASTFQRIFESSGKRLDFVFANAGIIERTNFYANQPETDERLPEPSLLSVDVDLKGVILTSYLALHYFRRSPHKGNGANLIATASCASFYPAYASPMYTAAKHGVAGFVRAIASHYHLDGIRANAICPGAVRTNIVDKVGWDTFPQHLFTPIETVTNAVLLLLDGMELCDANDKKIPEEKTYGVTLEISRNSYYIRTPIEFCDETTEAIMGATSVEIQKGGIIRG